MASSSLEVIAGMDEALQCVTEKPRIGDGVQWVRDQVASLFGHSLRTPLTFILGYADLLAQQVDGPHRRMAHSILGHAMQMREVLEDLTSLLEWGLNRLPDRPRLVDLHRVAAEVVSSLAMRAAEKEQAFDVALSPSPVYVFSDEWGIGVLLALLTGHLIKRAPRGTRLRLRVEREEGRGVVALEGEGGASREGTHDGIGLDCMRTMAEALGGCLDVRTTAGDTLCFRLTFPLACEAAPSAEER